MNEDNEWSPVHGTPWEHMTMENQMTLGEARSLVSNLIANDDPEDVTEWIILARTRQGEIRTSASCHTRMHRLSLIHDAIGSLL